MSVDQLNGIDTTEILHPAANDDQAALLAWAATHPIDAPTIPVNGRRQYQVTPPEGAKAKGHTRVTTFSSTLDDGAGLTLWRNRLLVRGLVTSPDLVTQARAEHDNDKALGNIADTALHVAGEKLAADIGTALHLATEHHDATGTVPGLPDAWRPDVDAYATCIDAHQLRPLHREVYGYVREFELVGKIDCLAAGTWGDTLRVVDLKTGKSCDRLTYAVQLAVYANCSHIWADGEWAEAPAIDREVGYIAHLPAGSGTCELVEVDLSAGWELAKLADQVRKARTGAKKLFQTAAPVPAVSNTEPDPDATVPSTFDPARTSHLQTRLGSLKKLSRDELAEIVRTWPQNVPKAPPWTDDQADALEGHLHTWDGQEAPFFNTPEIERPTPAPVPDRVTLPAPVDGDPVDHVDADALRSAAQTLPDDARRQATGWLNEAKLAGGSFGAIVDKTPTERRWAVDRAALKALMAFVADDPAEANELTRAAIRLAAPTLPAQPVFTTGALLAALTIDEAHRLADIADAYRGGDQQTAVDLTAVITRDDTGTDRVASST